MISVLWINDEVAPVSVKMLKWGMDHICTMQTPNEKYHN